MTTIIVLAALAIFGMLWFFRWRLKRMRKSCTLDSSCAVAIDHAQAQRKALSVQITKAENESRKAAEKSRDPDTAGHSRISVVIAVALFAGSLLAGWEMRGRTHEPREQSQRSHESPAVNGVATAHEFRAVANDDRAFDVKLAELRARPSLATVSAIDRSPPIPERRAEVLAALKPLLENESKSIRLCAANAVKRWE